MSKSDRPNNTGSESTLDASKQAGGALPDRVPALTILMHPDVDRIGEQA